MNTELSIYKKNRIIELQKINNSNVSRLNSVLEINIRNVQQSRQNKKAKQSQINNLINQYNNTINIFKNTLNNNILSIQKFVPKTITINKNKKALLIGINYTGTQNELFGCINDVNCVKERISEKGFSNIIVMTDLTSQKATRNNILTEFKNLLSNSQEGDLLFFFYSGHGSQRLDNNGDETTGYDQMICPCDLNTIVDDELKLIIQENLKPNITLFALFDSCFSGSVLDLRYQYLDSLNYNNFTENNKELETPGDVFMISGCNDLQTSADAVINNKSNGAMTWSLLEALKQKPNSNWRELIKSMRDLLKNSNFEQIPQFSCGNFENIDEQVFI